MSDLILAHNPDPIKDCPFCGEGSDPFYSLDPNYQDRHVIECGDCGKQERYEYSKEGAIENWNRRPKEDSLQQQNTALQQQVKDLQAENEKLKGDLNLPVNDIEYPRDIFHKLIKKSPYAFYLFQWVPYQTDARKWRLKMCHDVKHKDGRIEYGIWPNGSSCGSFKDEDVEFIRISRGQMGGTYVDPRDANTLSGKGGD